MAVVPDSCSEIVEVNVFSPDKHEFRVNEHVRNDFEYVSNINCDWIKTLQLIHLPRFNPWHYNLYTIVEFIYALRNRVPIPWNVFGTGILGIKPRTAERTLTQVLLLIPDSTQI